MVSNQDRICEILDRCGPLTVRQICIEAYGVSNSTTVSAVRRGLSSLEKYDLVRHVGYILGDDGQKIGMYGLADRTGPELPDILAPAKKDVIRDLLTGNPMSVDEIAVAIYGRSDKSTRDRVFNALRRLSVETTVRRTGKRGSSVYEVVA